jgi:ABC-type multidrug transport system fused ATPase/permease subunit
MIIQVRAALVSYDLFSLLCDDDGQLAATSSFGTIQHFGGPILYLFIYAIILFAILVWVDSGSILYRSAGKRRQAGEILNANSDVQKDDVAVEAEAALTSDDLLRVLGVTKTYQENRVVDDVSLGVSRDTVFVLLGPNGAGKTTTFNMIREFEMFHPQGFGFEH